VPRAIDSATSRLGFFYLGCGEADVVPGVGGKKRADLRDSKRHHQPEETAGRGERWEPALKEIRARFDRYCSANGPNICKIVGDGRVISADKHANQDQTKQR